MKKIFASERGHPFNWKVFIIIAIILRGLLWLYFGHMVTANVAQSDTIEKYFVKDDYGYFFSPVDNYFKTGHYTYLDGVPFTGRLPGYSMVYFIFRLFFNQHISLFLIVGLQFLLSTVSVYVLSLISYFIFNNNKRCFHITYWLYILGVFPGFFDFFIIAESLSVSSLIFSIFYLTKYIKVEAKNRYLIFSGLFLAWTIYLREYTGLLMLLFPLVFGCYLLFTRKENIYKASKLVLLLCLPFIGFEAIWVTRNYVATKKIILITTPEEEAYGKLYSAPWEVIDNLIYSWGEIAAPFDKKALGYYYRNPKEPIGYNFPDRIFNGVTTYNEDSLVKLRNLYADYYFTNDTALTNKLEKEIINKCKIYRQDYISHNLFTYWVIKPMKDFNYIAFFSGTGYLPLPPHGQQHVETRFVRIIFCRLYYTILLSAFAGLIWYFFIFREASFIPLLCILSFAVIVLTLLYIGTINAYSSVQEPRYFAHCVALVLPFSAYFFNKILPGRKQE